MYVLSNQDKIIDIDDDNLAALLANEDAWVSWDWRVFEGNKEALELLVLKMWRLLETVESLEQ